MNKYPDYIKQFKPKGTIVKKVRDKYYVYKATSKRVEGKSYPVQVIGGLVGEITEKGFFELTKTMVDKKEIIIREYGFTRFILMHQDVIINDLNTHLSKKDKIIILNSLIVHLSSNSFLVDEKDIYTVNQLIKKYNLSIVKQLNAIKKTIGYSFEEIEQLKYICRVKMGNKEFKSTLSKNQKELIKLLGIDEDEIR